MKTPPSHSVRHRVPPNDGDSKFGSEEDGGMHHAGVVGRDCALRQSFTPQEARLPPSTAAESWSIGYDAPAAVLSGHRSLAARSSRCSNCLAAGHQPAQGPANRHRRARGQQPITVRISLMARLFHGRDSSPVGLGAEEALVGHAIEGREAAVFPVGAAEAGQAAAGGRGVGLADITHRAGPRAG